MTAHPQANNIWRNLAAIPAFFVILSVGMRLVDHWLMSFLQGDDPSNDKFLFFIPIEPIEIWLIPFIQYLLVPCTAVYACAAIATSKRTLFGVAAASIVFVSMLFLAVAAPSDVAGMMLFRLWLWTLIACASSAFGLLLVFNAYGK